MFQRFYTEVRKHEFIILLIAVFILSVGIGLIFYSYQIKNSALETELTSSKSKISKLQSDNTNMINKIAQLQKQQESMNTIFIHNMCISADNNNDYINTLISKAHISPSLVNGLFNDKDFKNYLSSGAKIQQICFFTVNSLIFLLNGNFEKGNNNLIGYYEGDKIITTSASNSPNGGCYIMGSLNGNPYYTCGGGDGPCYDYTQTMMDRRTGSTKVILQCSGCGMKNKCTQDLLGIGN